MATNDAILKLNIDALRSKKHKMEPWQREEKADQELISYTSKAMRLRLAHASQKGRYGWWNESECTTQHLQNCYHRAIAEDDLLSVINYAAMIHARRICDTE
jgi:hypothetical protein